MKRRWVGFGLGALVVLGLLATYLSLPHWIGREIDARLAAVGFESKSRVSEFGLSGLRVDIEILKPQALSFPTLQLSWKLTRFWNEIPFEVSIVPLEKRELSLALPQSWALRAPRLFLGGTYKDGGMRFARIEATGSLSLGKMHLDFEFRPAATELEPRLNAAALWAWKLRIPAQNFAPIGLSNLSLSQATEWQGTYTRRDRHEFSLESASEEELWEWRVAEGNTLRTKLKGFSALVSYGESLGPIKLNTRLEASWQALKTLGHLKVEGSSLDEFVASFGGETRSRNFTHGKFQLGGAHFTHTLEATGSLKSLEKLRLSFGGSMDQMIYDKIPVQEVEVSARVRCSNLGTALSLEGFRKRCALGTAPLKLSLGRVGTKQPLRGVQLDIQPGSANSPYGGSLQAQWQGTRLASTSLQIARDFSEAQLSISASRLSLHEVLQLVANPKLSGRGELKASLELDWKLADGLRIWPAQFESEGQGWVRYADPALLDMAGDVDTLGRFQELMARGQQALVLKALEDFHYTSLSASLWRDPKLKMRMELKLKGGNPGLARSQPFEINIPIEGDLESLLLNSVLNDFSNRGGLPKASN